jgi:hypothetical protein
MQKLRTRGFFDQRSGFGLENPKTSAVAPIGVVVALAISLLESFSVLVVVPCVVSIPVKVTIIKPVIMTAVAAHIRSALAHALAVTRVVTGPVRSFFCVSSIVGAIVVWAAPSVVIPPPSLGQSDGGNR